MKYQTTGLEDLFHAMRELPGALQRRALRPGLLAAAGVVRNSASNNVPKSATAGYATGLLAKSIVVRSLKTRQGTLRVAVAIAPKRVSKQGVRVGLYGSVLEFGKSNQIPRPWLRPALRTNVDKVYTIIRDVTAKNLPAAIEESQR